MLPETVETVHHGNPLLCKGSAAMGGAAHRRPRLPKARQTLLRLFAASIATSLGSSRGCTSLSDLAKAGASSGYSLDQMGWVPSRRPRSVTRLASACSHSDKDRPSEAIGLPDVRT